MENYTEDVSAAFDIEQSLDCGNHTEDDLIIIENFNYWLEGVGMLCVGLFGLVGNSVSLIVLSSSDMRSSFNYLLIILSLTDIMFLLITLLDYSCIRAFSWPIDYYGNLYSLLFPKILYPVNNIAMTASILMVMVISHERYVAVCHPVAFRKNQNEGGRMRVAIYTLVVFTSAIIINIPKFLECQIVFPDVNATNQTDFFHHIFNSNVTFEVTELRKDPNYIRFYVNWFTFMFTGILPLVFLLFFNYKIFLGIKYTHTRWRKNQTGEINLAFILVGIVVVFVVCNLLRVMLNIIELSMLDEIFSCGDSFYHPAWFHCLNSVSHLLLVVNSSSTFLIYCSVGAKFKQVLCRAAGRLCGKEVERGSPDVQTKGTNMIELMANGDRKQIVEGENVCVLANGATTDNTNGIACVATSCNGISVQVPRLDNPGGLPCFQSTETVISEASLHQPPASVKEDTIRPASSIGVQSPMETKEMVSVRVSSSLGFQETQEDTSSCVNKVSSVTNIQIENGPGGCSKKYSDKEVILHSPGVPQVILQSPKLENKTYPTCQGENDDVETCEEVENDEFVESGETEHMLAQCSTDDHKEDDQDIQNLSSQSENGIIETAF